MMVLISKIFLVCIKMWNDNHLRYFCTQLVFKVLSNMPIKEHYVASVVLPPRSSPFFYECKIKINKRRGEEQNKRGRETGERRENDMEEMF